MTAQYTAVRMPASISKPPSEAKSLMDKWKNHYQGKGQDEETTRLSNIMSALYFWFICVTMLYVTNMFVIPYCFSDVLPEMTVYTLKVLCCFVFVQCVANWACVKLYKTSYKTSRDRPDLHKYLWEAYPEEALSNGYHSNGHVPSHLAQPEKSALPWEQCHICQQMKPPRAHHCKLCNTCILKRDHHCYMTGVCIGYYNQRYFVILNFYVGMSSLVGMCFLLHYMYRTFWPAADPFDLFLPVTCYHWFYGSVSLHHLLMVTHLYTFCWTTPMCCAFFFWQIFVIWQGKTSQEVTKETRIRSITTVAENFRSVFGPFWGLNFILPAQILYRQEGDGSSWPNLKRR